MISEEILQNLLHQSEHDILDFKAKPHRLDNDHFKSKFIKDVLAMANTPRDRTAYIVTGVKARTDGSVDLLGITEHPDDSDLHNILNKASVQPRPTFTYQPVTYENKSFGVFEFPIRKDGPYYPTRDFGVLKASRLYFRQGTMNDEATQQEMKRIYHWFVDGFVDGVSNGTEEKISIPKWDEFSLACHHFDKNRYYIFLLGPDSYGLDDTWSELARVPLSLVLDFDQSPQDQGVFSHVEPILSKIRSVHLWTLEDETNVVPEKACYWYKTRGFVGRQSSMITNGWREWNRKYVGALQELFNNFSRASGGRPLTMVSLYFAPEYIREICGLVDRAFGDSVDFVFAGEDADRLKSLADQFNGKTISIPVEDVIHGIAKNFNMPDDRFATIAAIPRSDGIFQRISRENLNWLCEDMEVLHSNIELEPDPDRQVGLDYLRGSTVTWDDLNKKYDADRDKTPKIKEKVEKELSSRTTARLNLYHWPGAGGTTVVRRVGWDIRRSYPVVLLKRIIPKETIGRFREIFKISGLPIFTIVEGADMIPDRLENLYTEAKTEHIPIVFLQVLRRFGQRGDDERTIFLGQNLSLPESYRFSEAYKRLAPEKDSRIEQIVEKGIRERTPFHFALTAFGRDYKGITNYVNSRLEVSPSIQKEIITYLAIAYYYGHKSVLAQFFAVELGIPLNSTLHLERVLSEPQLELLIREDDQKWRPAHQLIAEEVLKIVLSGNATDTRNWKRFIVDWSLRFIEVCNKGILSPSDELIDLMRRIFILRDEHELLGTEGVGSSQFSKLIEDIPNREGQLGIFKKLVEYYPEEPHFWGHLGRFYSIVMQEYDLALDAIDRAIALSPHDPVLYHMMGMCYRSKIYDQIAASQKDHSEIDQEKISMLKQLVKDSSDAFAKARKEDPDSEYAFISQIQLILRLLDFGFNSSGLDSRTEFLIAPSASWYRELLDEAENLMDGVRQIREGEKPSKYMVRCQAELDQVYDNYSRALEGWNNLLTDREVYAPPIRRQIVRAYLSRRNRDWTSLEEREVERIISLMEENMREEPSSEHNIRVWFRAIRYSSDHDIDIVINRIANWRSMSDNIDSHYYLYILHVLKALGGSSIERERALDLIEQTRAKSRNIKTRTRSFEWLGDGKGLRRLVHYSELGDWDDRVDFYSDVSELIRVDGLIKEISRPEAGMLELSSCGLEAFFVPARANVLRGRDENLPVSFYLGFSYDGLRAWSVEVHK